MLESLRTEILRSEILRFSEISDHGIAGLSLAYCPWTRPARDRDVCCPDQSRGLSSELTSRERGIHGSHGSGPSCRHRDASRSGLPLKDAHSKSWFITEFRVVTPGSKFFKRSSDQEIESNRVGDGLDRSRAFDSVTRSRRFDGLDRSRAFDGLDRSRAFDGF
jgi:hypothetical protein